jgi:hypothetical protein
MMEDLDGNGCCVTSKEGVNVVIGYFGFYSHSLDKKLSDAPCGMSLMPML